MPPSDQTDPSETEQHVTFADLGLDTRVLQGALATSATRRPRRSRPRPSRRCSRAATSSASPRPAPARPRRSRCRSCPASTCRRRRRRRWCWRPTRELALQVSEAFERYAAHLPGPARAAGLRRPGLRRPALRPAPRRARRRRHPGPDHGPPREGHARPVRAALPGARRGRRDAQHGLRRGRRDDPGRHPRRQAGRAVLRDHAAADPPDRQEVPHRRRRDHGQEQDHDVGQHHPALPAWSPTRRRSTRSPGSSRSRTSRG